ncbi:unnamed protein product [Protopolystoma xenopodis]|uniref:Uncharacterized protein n=1 Tax=Protopolystoma xenopodis TaxID=117903 RepID=A0A3S5CR61_9PLAT|nr:unnamed protein product [Protopolystoma xenopodis]
MPFSLLSPLPLRPPFRLPSANLCRRPLSSSAASRTTASPHALEVPKGLRRRDVWCSRHSVSGPRPQSPCQSSLWPLRRPMGLNIYPIGCANL